MMRTESHSHFREVREFRELKNKFLRIIKDTLLILLGIGSAAFGLESFLLPDYFIDGGAAASKMRIMKSETCLRISCQIVIRFIL